MIIKTILFCTLLSFLTTAYAQAPEGSAKANSNLGPFEVVDEMPEFPGGTEALYIAIYENIAYPTKALEDSITGMVYVRFVIDTSGEVTQVEVLRSPHELLSEEAVSAVKALPLWIPGRQDGKLVRVYYTIPIRFTLE